MEKKIYTTEYYANRNMNYRMAAGLGFTRLVIFTRTDKGAWEVDVYERNKKTGYCKNVYTGKRISQARWDALYATTSYAF